ncbi:MAG: hypothetical protein AAFZ91_12905 [Pseudomonadota bacterium]
MLGFAPRIIIGIMFAILSLVPAACATAPGMEERIDLVRAEFTANPVARLDITQHPVHADETFSRLFNISRSARAYLQLRTDPSKDAHSAELLNEVADYYLANPQQITMPHSSYWAGEYHASILAKFGTNGTERAGAIPRDVEIKLLEYMVQYVNFWSKPEHYAFSLTHETYYWWNSENHWWQEIVTAWGYLLVLKDDPDYRDLVLYDGQSVQAHYDLNAFYMKQHMNQRARKGFLVEISSGGYAKRMHNMYLMIYDTSPDETLRDLSQKSLDLWWAFWAEEQISGERGGGKVRNRRLKGLSPNADSHMIAAWLYFGTGGRNLEFIENLAGDTTLGAMNYQTVLSDYRPAPIIFDILEDRRDAPAYAVIQRRVGKSLGEDPGIPEALKRVPDNIYPIRPKYYDVVDSDILKYSWVSPNFILGTNMRPPYHSTAWVAGSAQSWWHGLLLSGQDKTYPERVVPTLIYARDVMGDQYAIQHESSFMTRKLNDVWRDFASDNSAYPFGVFISRGLRQSTETIGDFIFIDSPNAWVAVRAVDTQFVSANELMSRRHRRLGHFYRLESDSQPMIIEAAERGDYESFDAFRQAVRSAHISYQDGAYQYHSLSGQTLTMFDDRSVPHISDQPVNYNPPAAYQSRYISSEWDSGIVNLTVNGRRHVLDFSLK